MRRARSLIIIHLLLVIGRRGRGRVVFWGVSMFVSVFKWDWFKLC
jgi:hypothetical protein